uniref:Glycosyltransferase n=1 Tax=uncultured marine crenarchaeote E6-3G TaxID=907719 RepID=G9BAK8_9ARCH|nr:glycosyltransferase [uncultured marine crenarchaeote E6-3G]
MRIGLVHPSLSTIGGAELVFLEMIIALQESGHTVTAYTTDRVDWKKIGRDLRYHAVPENECYVFQQLPRTRITIVNLFLFAYSYLRLLFCAKRSEEALSINNYGEIFPSMADISYVHSVPLIAIDGKNGENPYQIPFWRITSRLYALLYHILEKITEPNMVITNSSYNAEIIKRHSRIETLVLHPPVNSITKDCDVSEKENVILTVSRINSKKNLSIIPEVAERVDGEVKFVIMGRTDERSMAVLKDIQESSRKHGVADRLDVVLDPDRGEIEEAFRRASIYLSTQPTEAFGMAVVEAMAAGCIPVVPRDGGPWFDVLDGRQGRFGFSFTNPGQAAELIRRILSNENLRLEISKRARRRSLKYCSERFRARFLSLIEGFHERTLASN